MPAGNALPNAAQDTVSRFCGKGTLMACVQPGAHQHPRVLFYKAAFQLGSPQHILVHGVVPPQVQDFALLLVEPHEVPVSPFLQPVQVPLDGSPTLWCVSRSSQFVSSANLLRVHSENMLSWALLSLSREDKRR